MFVDDFDGVVRAACARVTCRQEKGTAYLVGPAMAVTCEHVVRGGHGQSCELTFEGGAKVKSRIEVFAEHDVAVLHLEDPVGISPLPLAHMPERDTLWETWAYPDIHTPGMRLLGELVHENAPDAKGRPSLQLYSKQMAASVGIGLHGASGAPVLVAGKVVGHIASHVGQPKDPARAAAGTAYAVPAAVVAKALGSSFSSSSSSSPSSSSPSSSLTRVPAVHEAPDLTSPFDVFVAYSHGDREWVAPFVDRLKRAGLAVFRDEEVLGFGEQLVLQLSRCIERSRAAVVVISENSLKSRWFEDELSALYQRRIDDPTFKLIPIVLDGATPPALLGGMLNAQFATSEVPRQAQLDELLGVLQRDAKASAPASNPIDDVKAAARVGLGRLRLVWERGRAEHGPGSEVGIEVAIRALDKGDVKLALAALGDEDSGTKWAQQRALALASTGDPEDLENAMQLLEGLRIKAGDDAETLGILGGRYVRVWQAAPNSEAGLGALRKALHAYGVPWRALKDSANASLSDLHYVGGNVAAVSVWLSHALKDRDPEEANERLVLGRAAADVVLERLGSDPRRWPSGDFVWAASSKAKCHLLVEDFRSAKIWYGKARDAMGVHDYRMRGVMRTNIRRCLRALEQPEDKFEHLFAASNVAAFAGHQTALGAEDDSPFPPRKIKAVAARIRHEVQSLNVVFGCCSLARGSDILFAEAVCGQPINGAVKVYLAQSPEEFRENQLPDAWKPRFDALMFRSGHVDWDYDNVRQDDPYRWIQTILDATESQAKVLEVPPRLIAVVSGTRGAGSDTQRMIEAAELRDFEIHRIDIDEIE